MTWHLLAVQTGLGDSLASQPALALALLFGAGVLTSLTPCIYPMIPITAGIISGTAGESAPRSRVVGLTLAYVMGLALLYALAGLIAGLSGQLFGTIASSVWARLLIALMLALFGLARNSLFYPYRGTLGGDDIKPDQADCEKQYKCGKFCALVHFLVSVNSALCLAALAH